MTSVAKRHLNMTFLIFFEKSVFKNEADVVSNFFDRKYQDSFINQHPLSQHLWRPCQQCVKMIPHHLFLPPSAISHNSSLYIFQSRVYLNFIKMWEHYYRSAILLHTMYCHRVMERPIWVRVLPISRNASIMSSECPLWKKYKMNEKKNECLWNQNTVTKVARKLLGNIRRVHAPFIYESINRLLSWPFPTLSLLVPLAMSFPINIPSKILFPWFVMVFAYSFYSKESS